MNAWEDVSRERSLASTVSASIYGFAAWMLGLLGAAAALGGLTAYLLNVGVGVARWRLSAGLALVAVVPALAAAISAALLARRTARTAAAALSEPEDAPEGRPELRRSTLNALLLTVGVIPLAAVPPLIGRLAEPGLLGEEMRALFLLASSLAGGAVLALPFLYRAHRAAPRPAEQEGGRSRRSAA